MGQRGLCVRGGVAGITELCLPVEVSFLGEEESSECVVHSGLGRSSTSVVVQKLWTNPEAELKVKVMGRDTWEESERDGARRMRPHQDHRPNTGNGCGTQGP